jgi:hypothetical protein
MRIVIKKENRKLLAKLLSMLMLVMVVLPLLFSFQGNQGKALAAETFDSLVTRAVQNNYALLQGGRAVDGGYGNFGAYDAYILTGAGVDVSTWVYQSTSLKTGVLSLADTTIVNEGTGNQSSVKRIAQEYLAAKGWGDARASQLLTLVKNRQTAGGSFDDTLYGIYNTMPAFDALGRAGDISEINTATAITYILASQDPATKAWPIADPANWITNDFLTTAQAVRTLTYLLPQAGVQATAVQTAIAEGKTWLQARQQADGSFRDESGYDDPLVDTVEAILTMDCLGLHPAGWSVGGKSAVDYMRNNALNADGTFGLSKNLIDNTWAIDGYRVLGGSVAPETVLVTPATASITAGTTRQFAAQYFKIDGTTGNISATAAWTTDNTGVATVSAGGLVTGVAAGSTVVRAVYQSLNGTAAVTVTGGGGGSPQQGTPVSVMVTGRSGETLYPQTTVYLQAGDPHGITPVGALDKTGLSYSYDSIDYIKTIAGLGPQGMNGWMYRVNGATPGGSAINCTLSANDQVWWFYSTNPDNIAGLDGNNIIPVQKEKIGDELVAEALSNTENVKISLEKMENQTVEISIGNIKQLYDKNKEMTIENSGISLTFAPNALYTEQLSKALGEEKTALQIGAREVTASEKEEVLDKAKIGQSSGLFEIGGKLYNLTAQMVRESGSGTQETEKITGFNEPVKVTIDLSNVTLSDAEIKLTAIRYEKDSSGNIVPVKLGGSYDSAAKTFSFYTTQFSYYGVVKAESLVTVSMVINMPETVVNGVTNNIDVPPMLLNNRTMVPLRFIAESLGADVQWLEKTNMVEIRQDGKFLQLVLDQAGPGLDTPATIVGGRTLVPIRYVAESLGANVTWFASTQKIEIVK